MKLRGSSYLTLGLLRLGARSGYAIKKLADVSTANFWPTSLAQVYPELAALEAAGLVGRHDDSHGGRRRSAYALESPEQLELVRRLSANDQAASDWIRADALEQASRAEGAHGQRYPAIVARLSADLLAYSAEWLKRLEHELKEPPPSSRIRRAD